MPETTLYPLSAEVQAPLSPKQQIRQWWIYKITNPNGRVYIGKTFDIKTRFRQHRAGHKNLGVLYNSIRKYGKEAHKFEIIEELFCNQEYTDGREIFWIRSFMTNIRKYPEQGGMNLSDGGEGSFGARHSEEWKKQSSMRLIGSKYRLGHTQSKETIEKIRIGNLGKKVKDTKRIQENNIIQRGRAVLQYDLSGVLINEFRTVNEAAAVLGVTDVTVRNIIIGKTKRPNHANRHYTLKYK